MGINENIPINKGNGLMDNEGMCDSLVSDLNSMVKILINGQYIQFCAKVPEMTIKLANLKKGIKEELESKNKIIDELKQINDSLIEEKTGFPVERDGGNNGDD